MPGRFPKVFGVGLMKTGTSTLAQMLKVLGSDHAPYDLPLINAVAGGDRSGLADAIARHESFEDWPWPLVLDETVAMAPDAGFILTRRKSPEIWLQSVRGHVTRNTSENSRHLREMFFGTDDPWRDEAAYLAFYDNHLEHVRQVARDRGLPLLDLCWEEGDGWKQLCDWLEVDVVPCEVPHLNAAPKVPTFQRRVRRKLKWTFGRLMEPLRNG